MGKIKENPRYNLLSLRISDTEFRKVSETAKQGSMSLSEAARAMMFSGREVENDGR